MSRDAYPRDDFPDRKTEYSVRGFLKEIRSNPRDAYAFFNLGLWWLWHRQYENALPFLDEAVELAPNVAHFRAGRACLRATATVAKYRDGVRAIEDAGHALRLAKDAGELQRDWRHRQYLETLAAAYAETGNFGEAIRIQKESLDLAVTKGATAGAQHLLDLFVNGKPAHGVNTVRYGARRPRTM